MISEEVPFTALHLLTQNFCVHNFTLMLVTAIYYHLQRIYELRGRSPELLVHTDTQTYKCIHERTGIFVCIRVYAQTYLDQSYVATRAINLRRAGAGHAGRQTSHTVVVLRVTQEHRTF